jgi:hypothetical protein
METNPTPQDTMTIYIQIDNQSDYDFTNTQQDSSNNAPGTLPKNSNANQFSEQSNWTDIGSTVLYQVSDDASKQITMLWTISMVSPNHASCSPSSGSPKVSVDNSSPSMGDTITFTITN